jgi:hypothetical protein
MMQPREQLRLRDAVRPLRSGDRRAIFSVRREIAFAKLRAHHSVSVEIS